MNKKAVFIFLLLVIVSLLLATTSFTNSNRMNKNVSTDINYSTANPAPIAETKLLGDSANTISSISPESMIAYNYNLSLTVRSLVSFEKDVSEIIKKYNGTVVNINKSSNDTPSIYYNETNPRIPVQTSAKYYSLSVKVEATKKADFVNEVKALAEFVDTESMGGYDVGDNYKNIEEELSIQREYESRLVDMLNKTSNINELMQINQELSRVRGMIRSYDEQLKSLDKQIEYTTIYISATDYAEQADVLNTKFDLENSFYTALGSLYGNLLQFIELVVWILVYSPIFVVPSIIYMIVGKIKNRNNY